MATSNVWLRDLDDRLVCADQVTGMFVDRVPGLGWTVIASTRPFGDVELADFGRGGKARTGADHLCSRLPAAIAAAAQDPSQAAYVITYTPGPHKGLGQWSTTREAGPADATPIVEATRGVGPTPPAQSKSTAQAANQHADSPSRPRRPEEASSARDWSVPWDTDTSGG